MNYMDGHCDVLCKMLLDPQVDFIHGPGLDVTLPRLKQAHSLLQTFAIYLPEKIGQPRFRHILASVDLFHRKVLCHPDMKWVRDRAELEQSMAAGGIGALLSLEGADGLEGNLLHLRILYYLGVRMLGLTWNYANWAADGVLEPRAGGLTLKGRELVQECERLGIILDVSHLPERGFWEVTEAYGRPLVASHSNVYGVCPHPRNLKDEQLRAIIDYGGRIGLTFVPWFVDSSGKGSLSQLLLHLDHVCSLGGTKQIVFGSDFDGIDRWISGLEHPGRIGDFADLLCKYYAQEEVENFMYRNWRRFLYENLPQPS